jgi:hypothetical protein
MSAASSGRPSRTGWWISGLLLIAAIVCVIFAVTSFMSFRSQVNGFQRVSAPGQGQVTFSRTGGYQLYFEGPDQGRGHANLVLRSASTGQAVRLSALSGESESYTLGGHSGQAVASFTITRPGRYVLGAAPASGATPADVAAGRSLGGGIVRGVLLIVAGVLLFLGALLAALITAIRHRRGGQPAAAAQGAPMPSGWMPQR